MLHIIIKVTTVYDTISLRHEYWEEEKYNLPNSDKDRKPYYVCYTY